MPGYLNKEGFKARTVIPSAYVDDLEAVNPGWLDLQLETVSRWIDSRLRKRYSVPFQDAPPEVTNWLTRIVTRAAYLKIGVDPTDRQSEDVFEDAKTAKAEIEEAANSNTGLFEVADNQGTSAVTRGAPLAYSEQSPYVAFDRQANEGRTEDFSNATDLLNE